MIKKLIYSLPGRQGDVVMYMTGADHVKNIAMESGHVQGIYEDGSYKLIGNIPFELSVFKEDGDE